VTRARSSTKPFQMIGAPMRSNRLKATLPTAYLRVRHASGQNRYSDEMRRRYEVRNLTLGVTPANVGQPSRNAGRLGACPP